MKAITRIFFLDDQQQKFFGEGPCILLRGVEKTGSLRASALEMGMSYTKALKILKNAENALGFQLTMRAAGGKDGGGSILTQEGAKWLNQYEAYRDACVKANQKLYAEFFSEWNVGPENSTTSMHPEAGERDKTLDNIGCVIMASGQARRFGTQKLMADFHGEPMIKRILSATEGIFARRVVVTREKQIAQVCEELRVDVLLHDLPYRSDTVRLGLEAIGNVDSCMFCPADQPLLKRDTVVALARAAANDRNSIWRPCFGDSPGSPVLFPKWAFDQLMHLPEGKGGSYVIRMHPEQVRTIPVLNEYELMDADDQETLDYLADIDSTKAF